MYSDNVEVEFASLINGQTINNKIEIRSPFKEQVYKLFAYADNGSMQIIPVTLTCEIDGVQKSISVFVSTLSEKTDCRVINRRDKEKLPEVKYEQSKTTEQHKGIFERIRGFFSI